MRMWMICMAGNHHTSDDSLQRNNLSSCGTDGLRFAVVAEALQLVVS